MKLTTLCLAALLLASGAWGQQAKKKPATKQECDSKVWQFGGGSDGYTQYKCSAQGRWVVDTEAMKAAADEDAHRHKLAAALISRVLTEAELDEVMQQGIYLITEPMQPFSEEEKTKEFNDDLAQQFRLRQIAKAAQQEKKAPPVTTWVCGVSGSVECSEVPPFDVKPEEWYGPDTETANPCSSLGNCFAVNIHRPVHHRTCADPKRVLLMSEDGKWHCYDFGRLAR